MAIAASNNNRFLEVTQAQTVTASSAYTAKDAIGGKITIDNAVERAGDCVRIPQAILHDLAMQSVDADLVFFTTDPGTVTDKTAFDLADASIGAAKGVLQITTDVLFADNGIAFAAPASAPVIRCASTTLYAVLIARSTPTFAATTDVSLTILLERV